MKKIYSLFVAIFMVFTCAFGQVVFLEDFDGVPGSTAGGRGTFSFPAGWLLMNVDGLTPDAQVSYVNDAWERIAATAGDSCAVSTSWYAPAGTANDWMWTPAIVLPSSVQLNLGWRATSFNSSYRDGYEVRIMTELPTGGTGNVGNMISASTLLYSNPAEATTWTSRSVDLSAYQGKTVYIGFRNNSFDKLALAIDDVKVEVTTPYDAVVTSAQLFPYASVPLSQAVAQTIGGSIKNAGGQPLTGVQLKAEVFNSSAVRVYADSSAPLASLASGASASFTLSSWTPGGVAGYIVRYTAKTIEAELGKLGDTLYQVMYVTDSTYARDNDQVNGNLGIGAGVTAYLGQSFTIHKAVELGSVVAGYLRGYTGRKYGAALWSVDQSTGKPASIVATTDTLLYPSNDALLDTIPIFGGRKTLQPGTYVLTAIEFDSTLALATTSGNFTPGSTWVYWSSIPGAAWANVESLLSSFNRAFYLRLNVTDPSALPVSIIRFTGNTRTNGHQLQWEVAQQQGILRYEIERSRDGRQFERIGQVQARGAGSDVYEYFDFTTTSQTAFYRLKMIESSGQHFSKIIRLGGKLTNGLSVWPNPARGVLMLQGADQSLMGSEAVITDASGRVLNRLIISNIPMQIDVSNLPAGMYFMRLPEGKALPFIKE